MMSARNNIYETRPFMEERIFKECRECFASEPDRIADTGERFMEYFMSHATPEGVLFKTIKDITRDMNIPHQTLTRVLKLLENRKIIYRRNGIIGLRKD